MLLILGIVIIAICVVVTLLSPQAGLMIYWAWFIVRPQEIVLGLGGELPLERILVLALIASLVIHRRLFKGERFLLGRISWAFLGFLGVCYLSILTAVWRGGALITANDLAKTFVFFFCFVNLITGPKDLRRFLGLRGRHRLGSRFLALGFWRASLFCSGDSARHLVGSNLG